MPTLPDGWREIVRAHNLIVERQRSMQFTAIEGLGAVPLVGGTKIFARTKPAFEEWCDVDIPPFQNWASPLAVTQTAAWADVDLDIKQPTGAEGWTKDDIEERIELDALLRRAIERLGPVRSLRYGRVSRGKTGHFLVHCKLESADEMVALRRMTMANQLPYEELLFRLEVRVAPAKGTSDHKVFTLPGSTYDGANDPVLWGSPGTADRTLELTAVAGLRRALYGFLLAVAVLPHWHSGARHATALHVSGVLMHEMQSGLLMESEARDIYRFLLDQVADPDPADRWKVFDDSMKAFERGGHVSGYGKLGDLVGEEMRLALLRLRGGSDPDAIAEMFRRVVAIKRGITGNDVYGDFGSGAENYLEAQQEAVIRRYSNHPAFPPLMGEKGKEIPIIRAVLASPKLQRVEGAIYLPGVTFGARAWRNAAGFHLVSDDDPAPAGEPVFINVAPGLPRCEEPTAGEKEHWQELWDRHLEPLTDDKPEQYETIEQAIAWKVQNPTEKRALGLAIAGGGGIGKSALFAVILRRLYGSLVAKTEGKDLESRFRFADVGNCLFYYIEETNFTGLNDTTRELYKNLIKDDTLHVEHKYGRKGKERNVSLPFFLTNNFDPSLIIDGQPERSLRIIRGATSMSRSASLTEWTAYIERVRQNVIDLDRQLRDPRMLNAGRWYFLTMPVNETRLFATDFTEITANQNIESALSPEMHALIEMFQADRIFPNMQTHRITLPFTYKLLLDGIVARIRAKGRRPPELTEKKVGLLVKDLFNVDKIEAVVGEALFTYRDPSGKSQRARVRYFKEKLGTLIKRIEKARGVRIEHDFVLEDDDYGEADMPLEAACAAAYESSLTSGSTGY